MGLPNIQTAEIITFNTVKLKGVIRDVARGLGLDLDVVTKLCKAVYMDEDGEENIDNSYKEKYPELFEYADIITGTIVSIGVHPSGILITDHEIAEEIGLCHTKASDYHVTALNMKELDYKNFVKLDILG